MTAVRFFVASAALVLTTLPARPAPPVSALAYRPDGALLAAGVHNEVSLVAPATGEETGRLAGLPGRVTGLAFSPTGLLTIACGEAGRSGVVRLYDLAPGRPLPTAPTAELAAHKDAVYGLAFSPDRKHLATAGYDRTIKLWEIGHSAPRLTLTDHSDPVYAVAFSPNGKLLASAAADRAVKVWDAATGKRLYTLGDPTDWVYAVAWHPDGRTLAAAGVDKSIRLWDATPDGGRLIRSTFAHGRAVARLAFADGGRTLYSVGEDRVIKAWDPDHLVERRVFAKQPEEILSFAVRPDGKQLAVGRYDGTAQFLDPATGMATVRFLPVEPKPPIVASVTPNFGARGRPVRIRLAGQRLGVATGLVSSDPGVKAELLALTAWDGREAELTLSRTAAVGPIQLTLTSAAGPARPVRFIVDRFPAVTEQGNTDSASTAMSITLPTTIIGTVDRAGDTDYYRFEATAGQQIGAQVVAAAIGSKLDPVLTISGDAGQVVAEGTAGVLGYVVPRAGRYAVGIRDSQYRGGPDMPYRLHVGDVPVVTAVFPLAVQRSKEIDVHVNGVNLGSPHGSTFRLKVPDSAGVGTKVPVPLGSTPGVERPLGEAAVVVGEFPAVVAAGGGAELPRVPGTADGILLKSGESQTVRFPAKAEERLVIETHARRLGSPLDTAIEVLDAGGKPVPRATLRCVSKTFMAFRDHDDATPNIRLDAWNELGVNDYIYVGTELIRIKALPGHPDADCNFVDVDGRRVGFLDTTPTHHAQNSDMYKVEIHPPGSQFPPNGMPVFTLYHRNDDGGPGYGKDSRVFFDPPADGTYQVRVYDARGAGGPAYAYRLTVRPPRPDFTMSLLPQSPVVWRGGAVPVTVRAMRIDGFDGPITVRLDGLPPGFEASPTRIEAGETVTTIGLSAAADAPPAATTRPRLAGTATIAGREVVREAEMGQVKSAAPGDIVTTTEVGAVVIEPGRETRFVAAVERRNGFTGRIPLDVRGLPHGVTVQNIGLNGILITEKETRREIVLRAEPWVQPSEVPIVVLAKHERKGTEHAARPVRLTIGKPAAAAGVSLQAPGR